MSFAAISPTHYPTPIGIGLGMGDILTLFWSGGMTETNHQQALIFRAPKTGTIDLAAFLTYTDTVLQAGDALRVSLQTVDPVTGFPDGTQDQFRDVTTLTEATSEWVTTGLLTSDGTDGGTKRSVTQGELLALVLQYSTFTAGDTVRIQGHITDSLVFLAGMNLPRGATHNGTSWSDQTSKRPIFALKYSDSTYYEITGLWPFKTITTTAYASNSTPDERALRFQLPAIARVRGAWLALDLANNADLVLYDNSDNVLASVSVDPDIQRTGEHYHVVEFASSVELSANTTYRLSLKPTTASNVTLREFTVDSVAVMAAMPGGAEWYRSTRTDAGSWTDTTTARPYMGLILDGVNSTTATGIGPLVGTGKLIRN